MKIRSKTRLAAINIAGRTSLRLPFALLLIGIVATPASTDEIPRFQVDAGWPKPLPNDWIMGQAAGVAVDAQDHVWVIQRPLTLTDDEK
jgi:hypothetical protein